jgi:hypothetical protein
MTPFMSQFLSVIIVALISAPFLGIFVFSFMSEAARSTRSRDLKTFAQMKRALRRGSKNDLSDSRRSAAVFAMKNFAEEGADAAQRDSIADTMRDEILGLLHKTDNHSANDVWRMLETLAATAPSWEADVLEKVSRSRLEGWVRGRSLDRLVRLRSHTALGFLLELMDDPQVASYAAAEVARLGRRAATPEVLARLERVFVESEQNSWAPSAAAKALIALGQAANPVLTKHLDRFDPWTAFAVRLKAAEYDAAMLIERLFAAGIVGDDRRKLVKQATVTKMQKALNRGDGFKAVTAFLQRMRAIYIFDTEWDPVPDYYELLYQLARLGAPRVTIGDVELRMDGEACREVTCDVLGQAARFSPQFMGDWTDLSAVLTGLNAALAAAGRSERFANLLTGDQNACVIIGDDDGLASLVETFGLPVDANGNAAIAIGVAAEHHTAAQLEAAGFRTTRG